MPMPNMMIPSSVGIFGANGFITSGQKILKMPISTTPMDMYFVQKRTMRESISTAPFPKGFRVSSWGVSPLDYS